ASLFTGARRREESALEHSIEDRSGFRAALLPRLLHLTLDLSLTKNHRVEAGGNAEKVRRGLAITFDVHEFRGVVAEARGEYRRDAGCGPVIFLDGVDLGAVARREHHTLPNQPILSEPGQQVQRLPRT